MRSHAYAEEVALNRRLLQQAVEDQRAGKHSDGARPSTVSDSDIHAALCATFELLSLDGTDDRRSAQNQASAFEVLSMAAQLDRVDYSKAEQEHFANAVYDHWASPIPGVHCRALLNALLARSPQQQPVVLSALLKLLQREFAVGNKRSLHILASILNFTNDEDLDMYFPDLWEKLVLSLYEKAGSLQAAKIMSKLALRRYTDTSNSDLLAEHMFPLLLADSLLTRQTVFESLLPSLISAIPGLVPALNSRLSPSIHTQQALSAYLSLSRIALSSQADAVLDQSAQENVVRNAIAHPLPSIRFEALRLLVSSSDGSVTSRRISHHHFVLYETFWTYNICDLDSEAMRTNLLGTWKDLINRCRISSYAALRDSLKLQKLVNAGETDSASQLMEATEYLRMVKTFLMWWKDLAIDQLAPIKPYRCHMNALKFIKILLNEGIDSSYQRAKDMNTKIFKAKVAPLWGYELRIVSSLLIEKLLACTTSTYEDVKSAAFQLLKCCSIPVELLQAVRRPALMLISGMRDTEIVSGTLLHRLLCNEHPVAHEGSISKGG